MRGHWNRHHKEEAKVIVQFINDPTKSMADIRSHLNKVIQDLAKDPSMASKNHENSSFLRRVNFALDLANPYVPTNVANFMKAKDEIHTHKKEDIKPADDFNSSQSP